MQLEDKPVHGAMVPMHTTWQPALKWPEGDWGEERRVVLLVPPMPTQDQKKLDNSH